MVGYFIQFFDFLTFLLNKVNSQFQFYLIKKSKNPKNAENKLMLILKINVRLFFEVLYFSTFLLIKVNPSVDFI